MLLDSNILISSSKPPEQWARDFVAARAPGLSAVSVVEAFGYPNITPYDDQYFRRLFAAAVIYPVTDAVIWRAAGLRQQRRMGLGDALIAATALAHALTLVTRNTADFNWIAGLSLLDPLAGP